MTIKRVIQFDAFSLKYLKIGKQSPSPYLKELTLHLENYKKDYWFTISDYEKRCISDMMDSVDRWYDCMFDGDLELYPETQDKFLQREDIRFHMADIARDMILRGEY